MQTFRKSNSRKNGKAPRFEVVYHLTSLSRGHRLRLKVAVDLDDAVVPSLVALWKSANWMEREVWDMYGIRFEGHPDLRRILLYEEFVVGHQSFAAVFMCVHVSGDGLVVDPVFVSRRAGIDGR